MSVPFVDPRLILDRLGLSTVARVTPVQGGSDTALWRVECRDHAYALRVFAPGRAETCRREVAVMQAAAAAGVPVPSVQDMAMWRDHAALLLAWCPGDTVDALVRRRPWRAAHLGDLFGHAHAAIHRVAAPAILAGQSEAWISWAGDAALEARLRRLPARADRLLHFDYHPRNVMSDGRRITGVLDWTNARAGDPRADVARTTTILRLDAPYHTTAPPVLVRAVVRAFERGWRAGYARAMGNGGGAALADDNDERALFFAWAGAVMERDLARKREARDLARIHQWTELWAHRAGVR